MKHITEFIKESLINEVSAGLLTRAAEKAKSMTGAKYKRLAKEFEQWRDSHEREDNMVQQAVRQATKKNKPIRVTATNKDVLIDLIISSLENGITDLNYIDTSKITDMNYLFSIIFNSDNLRKKIDDIESLFKKIDISKWNVSHVTDMSCMFYNTNFNGDISKWDVSNVEYMYCMFYYSDFNQDISNWDVSNVINMKYMFASSKFNQDISEWNVSNVKDMTGIFYKSPLNGKEKEWWNK